MNEMLYGGLLGTAAGFVFNRIACCQVKRRTDDEKALKAVNSTAAAVISSLMSGFLFALLFRLNGNIAERIEFGAYILIAVSIGVVDLGIKKIPNLSVLALLAVRVFSIVYELCTGVSAKGAILPSLTGLIAAFILYQLPMLIGIPIGAGDVKLASAIGFCLGIYGFLQAALIMAAGLAIFLVYLIVTKKGSVRTRVPMGPFLAMGTVATVITPVLTGLSQQSFPL